MGQNSYTLAAILVIAIVTFGTRYAPFLFFTQDKPTPKFVLYIGTYLPPAVMAMLIIYSVRNVEITNTPFGLPELISILVVGIIHNWKSNYLLSIITGTVVYMTIVQFVI